MKKLALAVLASLALSMPSAYAQVDPAAATAVKELLATMKYRDMMQQAMQQMNQQMPAMMLNGAKAAINSSTKLSDEQKKAQIAKAEREIPKVSASFAKMFSDPKLYDDMAAEIIPLYARHFTAPEINEMTAFYKTPVGAKMLAVTPQLMQESMAISQRLIMPRMSEAVKQLSELK